MSFNIDISAIFGYAGQIINALMPVVYVVASISLGFVVVSKIISAFR